MRTERHDTTTIVDRYPSRVKNEPSIMNRQDPIVYSQWSIDSPLTQEQTNSYEQKGYLFLEHFFTENEINEWKTELMNLRRMYEESEAEHIIREKGSNEIRSIFAVHANNREFSDLAAHPRLLAIMDYLLGSNTYVHQSRINFKPGFTGKEFYWHSDFETWHVEDGMPAMRALSCSIALEDNYPYNGPLMVIPGSHKKFISCVGRTPDQHYKESLRKQEYGVPDQGSLAYFAEKQGIEMPVGKAGSVLLFDCNLLHGSSSNISPYPRSNVFIVYNSIENRLMKPFSGQHPRPEYIASRNDSLR